VSAVPFHAMAGAIMGYYFGLAHFIPPKRHRYYLLALLVPILLHGAYDYPLVTQEILLAAGQNVPWLGSLVAPVLALETGLALAMAHRVRAAQEAGHHEAASTPDYDTLHHPYQTWSKRRHLAGPICLTIGGAFAWFLATQLTVTSTALVHIARGNDITNATLLVTLDDLATLGSSGIALMMIIQLAALLVALWLFRLGLRLLNRHRHH
jgi:RsiW-degrading membrane proteinase PrsW (M82 family)